MDFSYSLNIAANFTHGAPYSDQLYTEFAAALPTFIGFAIFNDQGVMEVYFNTTITAGDITNILNTAHAHIPTPPITFSQSKTYTTGRLTIRNTAFTVLDKFIFKGSSPIQFSVNSYSTSGATYSVRFVNIATKEILASATFNNTDNTVINLVGTYTGVIDNQTLVIELHGAMSTPGTTAYIDSGVLDYN